VGEAGIAKMALQLEPFVARHYGMKLIQTKHVDVEIAAGILLFSQLFDNRWIIHH